MSSEAKVWMIDDKDRGEEAANLSVPDGIHVTYHEPDEFKTAEGERTFPSEIPELVLIDWELNSQTFDRNLSLLGFIREEDAQVPIYGFSEQSLDRIPRDHKTPFDQFVQKEELERPKHGERLREDIESYRQIDDSRGKGFSGLLEVVLPDEGEPEAIDIDAFRQAAPRKFYDGIPADESEGGELVRDFATWVRKELLDKPGLVWNEVWTATKLGLATNEFSDHRRLLEDARYNGVFEHTLSGGRWWESILYEEIVQIEQEEGLDAHGQLWKRVPEILEVEEDGRSQCSECGGEFPQTVGLVDDSLQPVHFSCSYIEDTREAPFEDLRFGESMGDSR